MLVQRPSPFEGFEGFEQEVAGKASLPRGGLDHRHDAGADRCGLLGPGGHDFGQGQLDRPLGLQVDDGGAMGFPFLGVFPGNDRLQGSNE